ncbi:MAG: hypothetical protein IJX69_01895 [Oscillospiraceae bacterium]|nr:hypothetical protein [Oscillospiraceae bacterium]
MTRLFLGLIFVLLDFELTLGTATFGLVPDFIGYFLMMKGMTALAEDNEIMDRWRHVAFALALGALAVYIGDLIEKPPMSDVLLWLFGLGMEIVFFVLLHRILAGLGRERMKQAREFYPVLVAVRLVCCLLDWIPLVGTVCVVAGAVVAVCFLVVLGKGLRK